MTSHGVKKADKRRVGSECFPKGAYISAFLKCPLTILWLMLQRGHEGYEFLWVKLHENAIQNATSPQNKTRAC